MQLWVSVVILRHEWVRGHRITWLPHCHDHIWLLIFKSGLFVWRWSVSLWLGVRLNVSVCWQPGLGHNQMWLEPVLKTGWTTGSKLISCSGSGHVITAAILCLYIVIRKQCVVEIWGPVYLCRSLGQDIKKGWDTQQQPKTQPNIGLSWVK